MSVPLASETCEQFLGSNSPSVLVTECISCHPKSWPSNSKDPPTTTTFYFRALGSVSEHSPIFLIPADLSNFFYFVTWLTLSVSSLRMSPSTLILEILSFFVSQNVSVFRSTVCESAFSELIWMWGVRCCRPFMVWPVESKCSSTVCWVVCLSHEFSLLFSHRRGGCTGVGLFLCSFLCSCHLHICPSSVSDCAGSRGTGTSTFSPFQNPLASSRFHISFRWYFVWCK